MVEWVAGCPVLDSGAVGGAGSRDSLIETRPLTPTQFQYLTHSLGIGSQSVSGRVFGDHTDKRCRRVDLTAPDLQQFGRTDTEALEDGLGLLEFDRVYGIRLHRLPMRQRLMVVSLELASAMGRCVLLE